MVCNRCFYVCMAWVFLAFTVLNNRRDLFVVNRMLWNSESFYEASDSKAASQNEKSGTFNSPSNPDVDEFVWISFMHFHFGKGTFASDLYMLHVLLCLYRKCVQITLSVKCITIYAVDSWNVFKDTGVFDFVFLFVFCSWATW